MTALTIALIIIGTIIVLTCTLVCYCACVVGGWADDAQRRTE